MSASVDKTLNIDSLARGDSHMVARLLEIWNAARAERATWPLPWDDDYETRKVSMACQRDATLILGVLAGTWVRHLLAQAGVQRGATPPPTASQQRRLIRLLNEELNSRDDGRELLGAWATDLLAGRTDRLQEDFERLAGDMRLDVLNSVINHVRRTSDQFNGEDITFTEVRAGDVKPSGDPEVDAQVAKILGDGK